MCHTHGAPLGGGGYFLVKGYWGCAAGWGRIFTTGLTKKLYKKVLLKQGFKTRKICS